MGSTTFYYHRLLALFTVTCLALFKFAQCASIPSILVTSGSQTLILLSDPGLETLCWQLILPFIIPPSALGRQDSPFFRLQKANGPVVWPDDLKPLCDTSAREAGTSVHPGAGGEVLICCRSTNPALPFFLSSVLV